MWLKHFEMPTYKVNMVEKMSLDTKDAIHRDCWLLQMILTVFIPDQYQENNYMYLFYCL